jgi:hypothetical protein
VLDHFDNQHLLDPAVVAVLGIVEVHIAIVVVADRTVERIAAVDIVEKVHDEHDVDMLMLQQQEQFHKAQEQLSKHTVGIRMQLVAEHTQDHKQDAGNTFRHIPSLQHRPNCSHNRLLHQFLARILQPPTHEHPTDRNYTRYNHRMSFAG